MPESLTHHARKQASGRLRTNKVVGADPCVCPDCAGPPIVPVSRPSTHLSRRLHPLSPPMIVPPVHANQRVTTGGYPYIKEFRGVGADPCVCPELVNHQNCLHIPTVRKPNRRCPHLKRIPPYKKLIFSPVLTVKRMGSMPPCTFLIVPASLRARDLTVALH